METLKSFLDSVNVDILAKVNELVQHTPNTIYIETQNDQFQINTILYNNERFLKKEDNDKYIVYLKKLIDTKSEEISVLNGRILKVNTASYEFTIDDLKKEIASLKENNNKLILEQDEKKTLITNLEKTIVCLQQSKNDDLLINLQNSERNVAELLKNNEILQLKLNNVLSDVAIKNTQIENIKLLL